jgi:Mg-chelatase subunit ChlI
VVIILRQCHPSSPLIASPSAHRLSNDSSAYSVIHSRDRRARFFVVGCLDRTPEDRVMGDVASHESLLFRG